MDDVRGAVCAFLVEHALLDPERAVPADMELSQVVDSIALMSLVSFLEDHYDLVIPDEDLTPENILTLNGIAGYVDRRLGER